MCYLILCNPSCLFRSSRGSGTTIVLCLLRRWSPSSEHYAWPSRSKSVKLVSGVADHEVHDFSAHDDDLGPGPGFSGDASGIASTDDVERVVRGRGFGRRELARLLWRCQRRGEGVAVLPAVGGVLPPPCLLPVVDAGGGGEFVSPGLQREAHPRGSGGRANRS